jgi:hypothetical protein
MSTPAAVLCQTESRSLRRGPADCFVGGIEDEFEHSAYEIVDREVTINGTGASTGMSPSRRVQVFMPGHHRNL